VIVCGVVLVVCCVVCCVVLFVSCVCVCDLFLFLQPTRAFTVTDAEAVSACVSLLDDHRVLVEPACGAALALLYSERCSICLHFHIHIYRSGSIYMSVYLSI